MVSSTTERRRALGAFLRAHRVRLSPAALGVQGVQRRRTPGLRREEIAQLAALSTTWYTWIEQGREVSVSPAALARLAGALGLTAAERSYVFDLAGKRDPDGRLATEPVEPPAALKSAVRAIREPAYILDRSWNAVGWNASAAHLFRGWLDRFGEGVPQRNLLRFIFLAPAARRLIRSWEERARRVVAEFRAECGSFPEDPAMTALVAELRGESKAFARLWSEQAVTGREGGRRDFNHPRHGRVSYEQISFSLAGRTEFKLVMLTRPSRTAGGCRRPTGSSR
jgi:transcriptional regulator with XRE-family HTH domain